MRSVTGVVHTAFRMGDASSVGEARRHAAYLAEIAQLDETCAGRLAIIATELGNNLLRHAHHGRLLLAAHGPEQLVEVISIDSGPGIQDLGRSLGDGFSTGGTPGTGLGAVKRLASEFDIHSTVPGGTVVLARVRAGGNPATRPRAEPGMICGGICLAAPGERECGDAWAVAFDGDDATAIVADGLGHGPEAAVASQAALDVFLADPAVDLPSLLAGAHAALRGTRGAAVALMRANAANDTIRSAGAGNVLARVISGTTDRSVITQHGTVGLQMRRVEEASVGWPPHALLVIHSDGIEARWNGALLAPVLGRDPVLAAALLVQHHCRGRDDATVVVLRRGD